MTARRRQVATLLLRLMIGLCVAAWGIQLAATPGVIVDALASGWDVAVPAEVVMAGGWALVPAGCAILIGWWLHAATALSLMIYMATAVPAFAFLPDPRAASLIETQMPLPLIAFITLVLLLPSDAP